LQQGPRFFSSYALVAQVVDDEARQVGPVVSGMPAPTTALRLPGGDLLINHEDAACRWP